MQLTIRFGEPVKAEDKQSLNEYAEELGGRIIRIAGEDVLIGEGSYQDMLSLIIVSSYLKHKELVLRQ